MPVVLVDRGRVPSEAAVLGDAVWQFVAVAEQDGLAIANLHQLGREGPVERPKSERSLVGQVRVKARRKWSRGDDAGVEGRCDPGIVDAVDLGAFRRGVDRY